MPQKKTKGHWPKGKLRHPPVDGAELRDMLRGLGRREGGCGLRAVARAMGISYRTIYRWKSGEDVPAPDLLRRLRKIAVQDADRKAKQ